MIKKLLMKMLFKTILISVCACIQASFSMEPADIYNNPRLIFHAIGPKFYWPNLEGIDPSVSINAMERGLGDLTEKSPDLSPAMKERIVKTQKSLARAKTNYLICIGLVKLTEEPSCVDKMALELSQDAKSLTESQMHPSILFIGGHYLYPKGGSLGGHTATYDAMQQEDGKLSFVVNNTIKVENQEANGSLLLQLVYKDLVAEEDLDKDFWKNVIKTNYMNPIKGKYLMESFYAYLDKKLNKGSNKTVGRSFHRQEKGVCGWKSISVWLHGKIAPGKCIIERNACDELAYLHYKKFMFEKMQACFNPDGSVYQETADVLKAELEKKIQHINENCKLLK
ncbi:hypothetical protein BH09DEP1_BH09DEP1_7000 [soil metagenome]